MTYVLHRRLGEDIVITRGAREIRLRLVAALRDSIFQRELLMSQAHFLALFPEQEGYRLLLVETPPGRAPAVAAEIENALLSAPTPTAPRNGSRSFTEWRTPTCPRSRRLADSGSCLERSALPRFSFAMCSSGGASWRCSAPWATGSVTFS